MAAKVVMVTFGLLSPLSAYGCSSRFGCYIEFGKDPTILDKGRALSGQWAGYDI